MCFATIEWTTELREDSYRMTILAPTTTGDWYPEIQLTKMEVFVPRPRSEYHLKSSGNLARDVRRALLFLSSGDRKMLMLYFGFSDEEVPIWMIAERFGVSEDEVCVRITNALIALRTNCGSYLYQILRRHTRIRPRQRLVGRILANLNRVTSSYAEPSCSPTDSKDDLLYEPLMPRIKPIYKWDDENNQWSIDESAFGWSNWRA